MTREIAAIHDFWFGPLEENGFCLLDQHRLWFTKSDTTDATCRNHFGSLVEQATAGKLGDWAETDDGLIALILLLDQFPRNIYRNAAQAFAGDDKALALAQHTITHGHHLHLPAIHQVFLYLPLEHAEDLEVQEECVTLMTELANVTGHESMASYSQYARAHRDVIAQFGRFPHRNSVLNRSSSAAELAYLKTHGGF
jgi:uncharacterized protein (DUF924 family)